MRPGFLWRRRLDGSKVILSASLRGAAVGHRWNGSRIAIMALRQAGLSCSGGLSHSGRQINWRITGSDAPLRSRYSYTTRSRTYNVIETPVLDANVQYKLELIRLIAPAAERAQRGLLLVQLQCFQFHRGQVSLSLMAQRGFPKQ